MTFYKTNIKSLPYILMVFVLLLFNLAFTFTYINTKNHFLLGVYVLDVFFIFSYNPWTKIKITEHSIIENGLFRKKEIFFNQIKQLSIIAMTTNAKYVKQSEVDNPSKIYQICVLKEKLPSVPNDYIEFSKKDCIQFDYRSEVYEILKKAII
jgi:hypothetical protein